MIWYDQIFPMLVECKLFAW